MDNNIINKLNNLQIDNTEIDPESRYNILKKQNIEDEKKAIAFRNSDEYKNWYDTEYKKSMEEMAEKKRRFCTGHILEPDLVFNPIVRLEHCEKCTDDTKNNRMHFELKLPKDDRLEYLKKELGKLDTIKREITFAYTCILNNHSGDILDLFNALFNMQINILDNDICRFKKEYDLLLVEYKKKHNNFGLFIYNPPPPKKPYNHTEEEVQ